MQSAHCRRPTCRCLSRCRHYWWLRPQLGRLLRLVCVLSTTRAPPLCAIPCAPSRRRALQPPTHTPPMRRALLPCVCAPPMRRALPPLARVPPMQRAPQPGVRRPRCERCPVGACHGNVVVREGVAAGWRAVPRGADSRPAFRHGCGLLPSALAMLVRCRSQPPLAWGEGRWPRGPRGATEMATPFTRGHGNGHTILFASHAFVFCFVCLGCARV